MCDDDELVWWGDSMIHLIDWQGIAIVIDWWWDGELIDVKWVGVMGWLTVEMVCSMPRRVCTISCLSSSPSGCPLLEVILLLSVNVRMRDSTANSNAHVGLLISWTVLVASDKRSFFNWRCLPMVWLVYWNVGDQCLFERCMISVVTVFSSMTQQLTCFRRIGCRFGLCQFGLSLWLFEMFLFLMELLFLSLIIQSTDIQKNKDNEHQYRNYNGNLGRLGSIVLFVKRWGWIDNDFKIRDGQWTVLAEVDCDGFPVGSHRWIVRVSYMSVVV